MAVNTSAALNPVLATTLPIVLSVLPRTSAPVEALRLSLLGVAAIHQSFLHSRSNVNRRLLEKGTVTSIRTAKRGAPLPVGLTSSEGDQAAAESLRLALLLRQNASQCLAYAFQSLDGSWSDATLAASASIALIDVCASRNGELASHVIDLLFFQIFAGGNDFESNLAIARQLIEARGGPENIIAANAPSRTSFGGGVTVSPARLLLETLAVYDVFGSLTTGREPTYLGHDSSDWWLDGDEWSYHKYSVEKVFAMSRICLNLVAKAWSTLFPQLSLLTTLFTFRSARYCHASALSKGPGSSLNMLQTPTTARLSSSLYTLKLLLYCRNWKKKQAARQHTLPGSSRLVLMKGLAPVGRAGASVAGV